MGTKLLVIDDDANICEMLKVYFENEGYRSRRRATASTGSSFSRFSSRISFCSIS